MEYITKSSIITKKVLNEETGELVSTDFKEENKTKSIRGGFVLMYYKSYEEITEAAITSNKDLKLFNWITNQFTKGKVDVPIVHSICTIDVSQPKFSKFIKLLVQLEYLKRTARGIYRLNPFVYVPYQAKADELQREWKSL